MNKVLILTLTAFLVITSLTNAQVIYPSDYNFTSPSLSASSFQIAPTGTAWNFSGIIADSTTSPNESGIAANGSQNLTDAPNGQAAYLQGFSSISQTITVPTGTISLTFDWEGRSPVSYTNSQGQPVTTGPNEIVVTLGGVQLFDGTPGNIGSFESVTTDSAIFAGNSYDLVFSGVSSGYLTGNFGDNMTFVDNIQANVAPVPEPARLGLMLVASFLFVFLRRLKSRLAKA